MQQAAVDQAYEQFFSTLSNKTRLRIIHALKDHPQNVTALATTLEAHQSTISHNLKRLRECGFVTVEKRGKQRVYTLNDETIRPLLELMKRHVQKYCTQRCCE